MDVFLEYCLVFLVGECVGKDDTNLPIRRPAGLVSMGLQTIRFRCEFEHVEAESISWIVYGIEEERMVLLCDAVSARPRKIQESRSVPFHTHVQAAWVISPLGYGQRKDEMSRNTLV